MKEKRKKKEGEKGEWRVVGGGRNRRGGCRGAMGSLFRPRVFARANKTRSDGSCSVKLILFLSFFSFFFFWFFGFLVFWFFIVGCISWKNFYDWIWFHLNSTIFLFLFRNRIGGR